MISILIVEDSAVVRQTMSGLIAMQADLRLLAAAENGLDALALLKDGLAPDVILADLNMSGLDGIGLTEQVKVLYPAIRVIILTMHAKAAFLKRALEAGARGYLLKNGDMDELYQSIRRVHDGELVIGDGARI